MSTIRPKREARANAPTRADQLRPLNLPQPVQVELNSAGLPAVIASCSRPENSKQCGDAIDNRVAGKSVEAVMQTWQVDDEWWRAPISRRYVEVILEGGKHVVLYEDLTTNDWFMQMP